ncbi:GNAT family N-acetyltransferase [Hymenobacter sp. BT635]|uniref:GNAT family N-acetyltransferase n=1 Tax=Hymenobacter nitidus TaxID=2880929 RepID=A0ABS8AHL1_9BACT|nr:GNAT family N-acetyltransferase [Hymenobacter nitidus]MCB2379923.1 GNAT family N-acetyltransferase [Hymenobacter nitidus]
MATTIEEYAAHHTAVLRQLYLEARQQSFTWADPQAFDLLDFDIATRGETILVALSSGIPVGFIAWWPPDNFIHSLFVAPGEQGKGVGKELLAAGLARMGRPATLKCLRQNQQALGFYEARGWTRIGEGETTEGPYWLLVLPE